MDREQRLDDQVSYLKLEQTNVDAFLLQPLEHSLEGSLRRGARLNVFFAHLELVGRLVYCIVGQMRKLWDILGRSSRRQWLVVLLCGEPSNSILVPKDR